MSQPIRFLLIDSAYPINTRNTKIINSIRDYYGIEYVDISVCAWNRENKMIPVPDYYYVYKKESPGGKLLKKLYNLFGYYSFCRKINKQLHPRIIIASHWDMLLVSSIFKKKNQVLIYENLDIPSTISNYLLRVLKLVERFAMRNTDMIVFASRFFEPLYRSRRCVQVTLENKPVFVTTKEMPLEVFTKKKLQISYIGGIRYLEILKNLVSAVRNDPNIDLYFHGEGHDLEVLKQYCRESDNIYFTGRYEYQDIEQFYERADLVWAAYPNKDYNVKYAISNKFHESMHYNVPCVFSEDTCLGDLVEKEKIGFTIDPYSIGNIRDLFEQVLQSPETLLTIKYNLQGYTQIEKGWEVQFANFASTLDKMLATQR